MKTSVPNRPAFRLAWIGSPDKGGGVSGMCRIFLRELADLDISLDVYSDCDALTLPELRARAECTNVRFHAFSYEWNWDSWYGRRKQVAFVMSFIKRLGSYRKLTAALVANHRREPYDAVVQFSQGELFRLGRYCDEIPIVLFPCVHAAGELYWSVREEPLARQCEPWVWRRLRNAYLAYRARLQRRDYNRARGVIGMSRRFNAWVMRDYGVPETRLGVVYQPIDTFDGVRNPAERSSAEPIRLLFVGRISVRKGLDLVLAMLPALIRDYPLVEVTVIGGGSLWSNYEPLMAALPRERCRWLKSLPNTEVVAEMRRSSILLVPSLYEPGGIVVAEALANGMFVVCSDEVGSAENLPASLCQEFPAGDGPGFAAAVRDAIATVGSRGPAIRSEAKRTAAEMFAPAQMAQRLLSEVQRLVRVPHAEVPT